MKFLFSLKPEDDPQVFLLRPVIQEAIVADLLKTGRQDMHQVTPYELCVSQCDRTSGFAWTECPSRKGSFIFSDPDDPAVGDGNLVSVSTQIFDGISETIKSLLDKRAPVLPIKRITEGIPFVGVFKMFTGRRKSQLSITMEMVKMIKIFALKLVAENIDGDKELFTGRSDL